METPETMVNLLRNGWPAIISPRAQLIQELKMIAEKSPSNCRPL
uniref:Uncharacterized protein n=1 Tax=Anguilla anguilla TaxID=7936 RepID=A0A0E9RL90_ANGAN